MAFNKLPEKLNGIHFVSLTNDHFMDEGCSLTCRIIDRMKEVKIKQHNLKLPK